VIGDVPSGIRSILYRTIFSNIQSITEQNMATILFAIYKDVHVTDHEIIESNDEKNFWVHKMNEENQAWDALVRLRAKSLFCCFILCMPNV